MRRLAGELSSAFPATTGTSVTTIPGSVRRRSLSENVVRRVIASQARPVEGLGHDQRHEPRFAVRERPEVVEHAVGATVSGMECLESAVRRSATSRRAGRASGGWDRERGRLGVRGRDSRAVPGGELGCRVDGLHIDDRRVRGRRFGADGGRAGAEAPRNDSVVAVNDEEEETRSGIAIVTIQAPSRNLVWMTSRATRPVARAPRPLMVARRCQPGPRSARQWRTMPVCESVKAVKTPIT